MKINTEYPYNDYVGYIITNRENRRHVCLVHKDSKNRKTTSYARYLMSVKEKRILDRTEDVDHKDGDKTNDDINNLQILTKKQNNEKKIIEQNISRKMVEITCPNCKNNFEKEKRNTFLIKGGLFATCSRTCLHEILKLGLSKKQLLNIGKNQIVRFFSKNKFELKNKGDIAPIG